MLPPPRLWIALAVLAALAGALGGCASGKLTLDYTVIDAGEAMSYHLDDDGKLTVTTDESDAVDSIRDKTLHTARLDAAQLRRLKDAIVDSGFLLAGTPDRAWVGGGPSLRVDIWLGLMHNQMTVFAGQAESVDRISGELNQYLPDAFRLPTEGKNEDPDIPHDDPFRGLR